ncbi:retropepsin-like aspartic protease family protein [Polycladidibacter hongkongensis]|uniref:retropepsin-like aspartic protease family protein n=1 Tax=Polycladidibacter hongkongensis TaxID=1647556 RepID=UPI0008360918|nr:TIGR02281 family clan AA aspartic protease [Pseudovibrio hongkongensis]
MRVIGYFIIALGLSGLAYFVLTSGTYQIDDVLRDRGPRLVALVAILLVLLGGFIAKPPKLREALPAALTWGGLFVLLIGVYAFRFELLHVKDRMLGALLPGQSYETAGLDGRGSALVMTRGPGGHFETRARVNGAQLAFLVDTGASTVTLRAEDAQRAGIDVDALAFNQMVSTANGTAFVARVLLQDFQLGPLHFDNLPANVTKPGMLGQSLLGMNALNQLHSWQVEGNRLIIPLP